MPLFTSKNQWAEIFISIWEWCPTWCQSCSKTLKPNKSLKLADIQNAIDTSHSLSDKNFSYFLYGTNNITNPEIKSITQYIESLSRNYKIQIPLDTKYLDITHLLPSPERGGTEGWVSIFIVSKKITQKREILEVISSIKEFFWKENVFVNYDFLIDLKYKAVFESILKKEFEKESEWIYHLDMKNIRICLRSLYNINYKEKKVENLNLNSCLVYDSFDIGTESIDIDDHIEIEPNLDVTFHNPLCYIGYPKISNIWQERGVILKNFSRYKNEYLAELNSDMENSCFECIRKGFDYRK